MHSLLKTTFHKTIFNTNNIFSLSKEHQKCCNCSANAVKTNSMLWSFQVMSKAGISIYCLWTTYLRCLSIIYSKTVKCFKLMFITLNVWLILSWRMLDWSKISYTFIIYLPHFLNNTHTNTFLCNYFSRCKSKQNFWVRWQWDF